MVLEIEIKKVPVKIIKFDETNPNEMTDEQYKALKLAMNKFGYLAPVILDKDFTVVDGQHRVKVYQELNKDEIPAYVIDIDTIDKKILRQLMNKLKGQHDPQKDKLEFQLIREAEKLKDLSDLIAVNYESLENMFKEENERLERNSDRYDVSKDYYINGVVKQLVIFLENDVFEELMPKLDYYMSQLNIDNHTDMFMEMFSEYERNHPRT